MTWPLAGLHWITPEWDAPRNVVALSTLRGIRDESDPYSGFNLAHHVDDDPLRVARNRKQLQRALGFKAVQWLDQVHGVDVVDAERNGNTRCADAVYTCEKNLACAVLTADCLPAVFCNRSGTEVAVAHAGWRGLCAGVLENTVRRFAVPADQLLVWLGPAIGPQVFEVGPEVREAFLQATPLLSRQLDSCFVPSGNGDRLLADLYSIARIRLAALGVSSVFGGDFCTLSDSRFYSFRRAPVTGRQATLVLIRR